jgi:hypothetical protein
MHCVLDRFCRSRVAFLPPPHQPSPALGGKGTEDNRYGGKRGIDCIAMVFSFPFPLFTILGPGGVSIVTKFFTLYRAGRAGSREPFSFLLALLTKISISLGKPQNEKNEMMIDGWLE